MLRPARLLAILAGLCFVVWASPLVYLQVRLIVALRELRRAMIVADFPAAPYPGTDVGDVILRAYNGRCLTRHYCRRFLWQAANGREDAWAQLAVLDLLLWKAPDRFLAERVGQYLRSENPQKVTGAVALLLDPSTAEKVSDLLSPDARAAVSSALLDLCESFPSGLDLALLKRVSTVDQERLVSVLRDTAKRFRDGPVAEMPRR